MAEDQVTLDIRSEEGVMQALNFVANGVANGRLSSKQGDVLNTSVKQVSALVNHKRKYLEFMFEVMKKSGEGQVHPEKLLALLPAFFSGQTAIEGPKEEGKKK